MQAELKWLHSPDIIDLESYQPKNAENFSFLLQIMVGPKGERGEESFDVQICTPKWMEETFRLDDVVILNNYIVMRRYNYQKLLTVITSFLKGCYGDTWLEVAQKVSQLGRWEFENYRDYKPKKVCDS